MRPVEGRCGNCGESMARHVLDGHYGTRIEIDVCAPCHLLWFDTLESVRLSGVGLLDLIGVMAQAQRVAHRPLAAGVHCPRCNAALKRVHNRSRFGPTLQLECAGGHGFAQTFGLWLSEKGLWRELSPADRARLRSRGGVLHCLNCGGPLGDEPRCRWCTTPPGVIDLARLARAVDIDGATDADALHRTPLARRGLNCIACGAAVPAGGALSCDSCAATLVVGDAREVRAALDRIAPALRRHLQVEPAPHVKARRVQRQREGQGHGRPRAREMEVETLPEHESPLGPWRDWLEAWPLATMTGNARWVAIGLLLLALLASWWA